MIAYTKAGMSCQSGLMKLWSAHYPFLRWWGRWVPKYQPMCRILSRSVFWNKWLRTWTGEQAKKCISAKNFLQTGESFPARTVVFMSTTTRFHGQGLVQANLGIFLRPPNGQNATPEPHLQALDIGAEEWRKFSCTSRSLALVTMLVVEDIRLDLGLQGNKISAWIRERQTK